jgi:hypothetical protein
MCPPHSLDLTPPDFNLWGAAKYAVYHDCPRMLNELKTAIIAYTRDISQTDCKKCLRIKLNRFRPVSTLMDITSNTFYKCTVTFQMHRTNKPEWSTSQWQLLWQAKTCYKTKAHNQQLGCDDKRHKMIYDYQKQCRTKKQKKAFRLNCSTWLFCTVFSFFIFHTVPK